MLPKVLVMTLSIVATTLGEGDTNIQDNDLQLVTMA